MFFPVLHQKEGNALFNDIVNTFYDTIIWLRISKDSSFKCLHFCVEYLVYKPVFFLNDQNVSVKLKKKSLMYDLCETLCVFFCLFLFFVFFVLDEQICPWSALPPTTNVCYNSLF